MRSRRSRDRTRSRDAIDIANPRRPNPSPVAYRSRINLRSAPSLIRQINDLRHFHPDPMRIVRHVLTRPRYQNSPSTKQWNKRQGPKLFLHPKNVPICIRRKIRRAVLIAVGGAGKGKRVRRPKYNHRSQYRC